MAYESDPIAIKVNELVVSLGGYMGLMCFDELNPAEQALIAVWELEQEIYNGGFMQYFQNGSGARVPFICDVLRAFDAGPVVSMLERAISIVGPDIPWNDDVRRFSALQTLSEDGKDRLFQLNREFDAQTDELNRRPFQYLSQRRDQIDAPEEFWTEGTIQ